jgi:hypothetical protein
VAGDSSNHAGTRLEESFAGSVTANARNRYGQRLAILNTMQRIFETLLIPVPEQQAMNAEFYLILKERDLTDELANAVFEAGFDDSSLVIRGANAAIWIRHRPGDFKQVVHDAIEQAGQGGLTVRHVEMESAVFA